LQRRSFLRSTMTVAMASALFHRDGLAAFRQAPAAPPDVAALRGDGGQVALKGGEIKDLRDAVRGRVLLADSDGYETARQVLNPSIDKRPALIVQATGVEDVRQAVMFGHAHALLTAVKCGGHSSSGASTCNGGLMIDLSPMRAVRVDAARRRVWASGGTLLGLIDHECAPYELATTMGTVSHTGVGGLTTGGGFGRLARRFGLALDNVTAVEVVAADGRLYRADATDHQDLYWGVRGGGGNFGVVTGFEFELHPMQRTVVAGSLTFPGARVRDMFSLLDDYAPQAPDMLQIDWGYLQPPGNAPRLCGIDVCFSGPEADAERALAPLRKLGTPLDDSIKRRSYLAVQKAGDATDPRARGSYLKSGFIKGCPPALVDALVGGFEGAPERVTMVFGQQAGGAISRIPVDATAFPNRTPDYNLLANVGWPMGTDGAPHMAWARSYWAALEPHTAGFYVNEAADGTAVNGNYGSNYARLVEIKNRYDPTNLFRLNANVRPTTAPSA